MDVIADVADVRRDISRRLTIIGRQLRSLFDRHAGELAVTRSQWSTIIVVARRPGATQRAIADALEMSESFAGRLIDRLCAEGLLRRQEHDSDKRARAVYLGEKGEPLLTQLSDLGRHHEERLISSFSYDEIEEFQGFLDRIYVNLQ
jgi:MarR family transcriptional regulator for hemolysin